MGRAVEAMLPGRVVEVKVKIAIRFLIFLVVVDKIVLEVHRQENRLYSGFQRGGGRDVLSDD